MLTDLQIAQLLQSQYNGENIFDYKNTISDVTFAVSIYNDCVVVLFEGSHDRPDWVHDAECMMIYPTELKGAGVHAGFWIGLDTAFDTIFSYLPKDKQIIVCGHSLGAGRVNPACGLLLNHGYTMVRRVKFASPRSNDQALAAMLDVYPLSSYWNYHSITEHDFVCDVPRRIMPVFPYYVDEPHTIIDVPPQPDDDWGVLAFHHLFLYIEGLQNGKFSPSN